MDELAHRYPPRNAGVLCLDFANTLEPQAIDGQDRDHLTTNRRSADYIGLLAWAAHAEIVSAPHADTLARLAAEHPRRAGHVLRAAIDLRTTISAAFSAVAHGRTPARADLRRLRDSYLDAVAAAELDASLDRARWTWRAAPDLAAPLYPITASAIDLIMSEQLHRIKQCAGERCWVLFVDQTKNRSRRWCQMRYCGNVQKSQRQAARRRQARAATR